MRTLLVLLAAGIGLFLLLRVFMTTPPADLARVVRLTVGWALIAAAIGLLIARQVGLALPLGVLGVMVLNRARRGSGRRSGGQQSQVRSAGLEMMLDHDTGDMDGRILAGRHEGRLLSGLSLEELFEVAADFQGDADSLRLLEAYLDRTHPGWREHVDMNAGERTSAPAGSGPMSTEEAYEILGLEPGASQAEVRQAHRRLMKQVHPDRGGSSALAAKINEAKDRLLRNHR
jgi:DnaJ-domain-containing protein 1